MKKALLATTAGIALAVPMVGPVFASDAGSDEVKTKGVCSVSSEWELKSETDDDGVKVEFEVDSGVAGQSWDYVISGPSGQLAAGTATTDPSGEFDVEIVTAGAVSDGFTATATSGAETCDSTVGVGQERDDDSEDDGDDDSTGSDDEDVDEGQCTAASSIVLSVDKSGKTRSATLSVKGSKKGQKWHYKIKRGNKIVRKGAAKTKGKNAAFQVKAHAAGKGALTADAERSDHSEECTTDDQYDD